MLPRYVPAALQYGLQFFKAIQSELNVFTVVRCHRREAQACRAGRYRRRPDALRKNPVLQEQPARGHREAGIAKP